MRKKLIGIVVGIIVLGGAGLFMANRGTAIEVDMAVVTEGDIEQYVEELGVIKVKNERTIFATVGGTVTEVLVNIGDQVKKGDVLVRLDSQQQAVNYREMEKLVLELEAMERTIQETQRVVNNKAKLYEEGIISFQEYQDGVLTLQSQQNTAQKIRVDLEYLRDQVTSRQQGMGGRRSVITAPLEGTVLEKNVEKGSYLQIGAPVIDIGDLRQLYLEADVLVSDIGGVKEGALVRISNRNLGITDLEGRVTKIHPQAFSKVSDLGIEQKRIRVEVEFETRDVQLRPGYDLDVKIVTDQRENRLLIAKAAVFQDGGKEFVFVSEEGKAVVKEIETGIESHRQVEVIAGLSEGDVVIVSLDERLGEGVRVKERK